jgi:hypothetical protein
MFHKRGEFVDQLNDYDLLKNSLLQGVSILPEQGYSVFRQLSALFSIKEIFSNQCK